MTDPMDLVRQFYPAVNRRDADAIAAFYHPDCIVERVFIDDDDVIEGRGAVAERWRDEFARYAGGLPGGHRVSVERVAGLETGWGWVRADWLVAVGDDRAPRHISGYSHFWIEDGLIRRHRSVAREVPADTVREAAPTTRHYPERPIEELLLKKLRPGDIYTHMYSGLRRELLEGAPNPALTAARARGVYFDVGHGAGSFRWKIALPIVQAGFLPDSISTDLHTSSMNGGMKSQIEVMSKFLALGETLPQVVAQATWHPARQIKQDAIGHLGVGADADIAVLRVERGTFGFVDNDNVRYPGTQRIVCELTIRAGAVVYDLNGRAATGM